MGDVSALSSPVDAPDIKAVAGITSSSEVLTAGSETATTTVQGTTPSWLTVRGRTVAQGRFLDNQDVKDHTAVAVLGATTASELFSREDPVGQTVDVNGVPVTVVGVLTSTGASSSSSSTSDPDDTMIIPITTGAERIFGGTSRNSVSSIAIQARSSADLTGAYQEADHLLLELHGITNPTDADFTVTSQASLIAANTSVDHTLTILLGGIAAISLIVGGIGVMNIMLVSVTERIREIGLRKALGATPRVIRRQFLVEASVLGLVGGMLGVLAGLLGVLYLPGLIGDPISTSPTAAVGALAIALAIGVLFGVYPASRAATWPRSTPCGTNEPARARRARTWKEEARTCSQQSVSARGVAAGPASSAPAPPPWWPRRPSARRRVPPPPRRPTEGSEPAAAWRR